jgi:hypothetical protein
MQYNVLHVTVGVGNYLFLLSNMFDFERTGTPGNTILNFLRSLYKISYLCKFPQRKSSVLNGTAYSRTKTFALRCDSYVCATAD